MPWWKFNSILEYPFGGIDPEETTHWVCAETRAEAEKKAHEEHLEWVHNRIGSGVDLSSGPHDRLPDVCPDEDCPGCKEDGSCLP